MFIKLLSFFSMFNMFLSTEINIEKVYNPVIKENLFFDTNNLEIDFKVCEYVDDFLYLGIDNNLNLYVINNDNILIKEEANKIISYTKNQNHIYVVIKTNNTYELIKYNINTKEINNIELDYMPHSIVYYNKYLYVTGSKNNDAYIIKYNDTLQKQYDKTFGGSGRESFQKLIIYNDLLYISLFTDGISNNSPFNNIGNNDEKKAALIKLNDTFTIIDFICFNEKNKIEYIKDLFIKGDKIYLNINGSLTSTFYELDLNLNITLAKHLENLDTEFILIPNYQDDEFLYLSSLHEIKLSTNEVIYHFNTNGRIKKAVINKGKLKLNIIDDNYKSIFVEIDEYQLLYCNDLICNKLNYDETRVDQFSIKSYFEALEFKLDNISPFFEKMIFGKYMGLYKALRNDDTIFLFNNPIIVESFTNFSDKGIYNTGKVLEFFGRAKINNERIFYGHLLDVPGTYNIEITDIEENVYNYTIYIKDYYKEQSLTIIENTKNLFNKEDYYLEYLIEGSYDKVEVYVNDQIYNDINIFENRLKISFPYNNSLDIKSYRINKIVLEYNDRKKEIPINKIITINYLKQVASIKISKEIIQGNLKINCEVKDDYQTFNYLLLETNNGLTYITNDLNINLSIPFKLYFVYDLGNGLINKKEIIASEEELNSIFDCKLNYDGGRLESIDLIVEDFEQDEGNKQVTICGLNVKSYKKDNNNFLIEMIIVSIIFFLLCGLAIFIRLILFKKKHKYKIKH